MSLVPTTRRTKPGAQHQGPLLKVRRYGRNDFERFDEETARGSHLNVGGGKIGRVKVDCKYHWEKAQWGVLGAKKRPAGIVYLDITFKQPHGYWLDWACVYVTISEDTDSYALDVPRRRENSSRPSLSSEYAVQIREHYGPQHLAGKETTAEKTVTKSMLPTLGVMSFAEISGMGRESVTSRPLSDRWSFKGTRGTPEGGDGIRMLQWELKENDMEPGQTHNEEYHTAFAFEHSERPVYMRVEIEGKLSSSSSQWKYKVAKFSSKFGSKDYSTLTHIDLNRRMKFEKSLDLEAEGLDREMQDVNPPNRYKRRSTSSRDSLSEPRSSVDTMETEPPESCAPESCAGDDDVTTDSEAAERECELKEAERRDEALRRALMGQLDDEPNNMLAASIHMEEEEAARSQGSSTTTACATQEDAPTAAAATTTTTTTATVTEATRINSPTEDPNEQSGVVVEDLTLDLLKWTGLFYLFNFIAVIASRMGKLGFSPALARHLFGPSNITQRQAITGAGIRADPSRRGMAPIPSMRAMQPNHPS